MDLVVTAQSEGIDPVTGRRIVAANDNGGTSARPARATLDDLMRFVPGPDLPGGGRIVGLDGIREGYATGRGTFRTRATTRIENITPRRKGIVVTDGPQLYRTGFTTDIGELARLMRTMSGLYDQAARAASSL